MKRFLIAATLAAALILCFIQCTTQKKRQSVPENAIYAWKNWFNPSQTEQDFLKKHNINRVYVRLFDVVPDFRYGAAPDASAYMYVDRLPEGTSIVPTVFITLEALKNMRGREEELALEIYELVMAQMNEKHLKCDELQIDCDWTGTTRESFFELCQYLSKKAHSAGQKLSATIRLHQLSQPAPPVDSGVLMVYNVGDLKDAKETNSILRTDIVKKYLSNAPKYELPLDVAYPIFSWGILFSGDQFSRIMRISEPIDSIEMLKHMHDNVYEVIQPMVNFDVLSSDYHQKLRYEFVTPETLSAVKSLVEKYLGGRPHRVILYHLDESTINKYTDDEINAIYE